MTNSIPDKSMWTNRILGAPSSWGYPMAQALYYSSLYYILISLSKLFTSFPYNVFFLIFNLKCLKNSWNEPIV